MAAPHPVALPPRKVCRIHCTGGLVYESRRMTLDDALLLVEQVEEAMSGVRFNPVLRFDAVGYDAPVRLRVSAIIAVEPVDADAPQRGRR